MEDGVIQNVWFSGGVLKAEAQRDGLVLVTSSVQVTFYISACVPDKNGD